MNKILKVFWMGVLSASILSNPMISYPGRDSGIFLYIGSLILKGKIPYLDAWENKGPLIFYLNALGLALTGGSRWGIWLLEFFFIFISGYIAYRILEEVMGEIPALMGASIFIFTAGNVLQGGNFSEEYSLLFSFLALFFFISSLRADGRSNLFANEFIIGVTLGLNILLRPNNISVQIAICAAYFALTFFTQNWKLLLIRAGKILGGMLLALIPFLLYFAAKGALTEMFNVVIVFNSQYSEGITPARIMEGVFSAANDIGFLWIGFAVIGYILAAAHVFKSKDTQQNGFFLMLLIGLPIEAILSAVSGKNYPHYFIGWSLYAGMLCSYIVYLLVKKFTPNSKTFSPPLILILILAAGITRSDAWKNYGSVLSQIGKPNAQLDFRDPVANYIQQHTAPEDKVLIWGFRPIINFASHRESPAAYLPYPLSHVDTPLARRWADGFYSQIKSNPPVLIINMIEDADRERIPDLDPEVRKGQKIKWKEVVLAHNYKETLEFISQNYIRVDVVHGADIYRLKNSAP